jgi:ferric-dicitrate binding protein FerR (iron transport regulator)
MSGGSHRSATQADNAATEAALAAALRARPLSAERLASIGAATLREWRAATTVARRRRQTRWIALAAAVVGATIGTVRLLPSAAEAPVLGSLVRVDGPAPEISAGLFRHRILDPGDRLRSGDSVTTRGPALVALERGGTLRLAPGSVFEVQGQNALDLQRGTIYLELPPGRGDSVPVTIQTAAGRVQHIGTQFEVASFGGDVRIRVREGRIRFIAATGAVVADAGTELLVSAAGTQSRRAMPTYGRDWLWIAALAPDYELENKRLIEFLEWNARETGRKLDFADRKAAELARRTILHGTIRGREPLDALASVLATTSLRYELRGDTIRVHSER